MKKWILIFISAAVLFCSGCKLCDDEKETQAVEEVVSADWTVLVYMAADNELESAAINNINEMEKCGFDSKKMNVLVLLDRSEGYDASNGDWTDTRLFKISNDKKTGNSIVSKQMNCPQLGLSSDGKTELNMASKETMTGFIDFAMENYKSEHYALIVWGHGSGWRGFVEDDYSSSSKLSLSDLGEGIQNAVIKNNKKLDLICFDTCFSLNLETIWELKDYGMYLAGTAGMESSRGWNYSFLKDFTDGEMGIKDFCSCLLEQFKNQYSFYEYGTFGVVKLEYAEETINKFNSFCALIKSKITDGLQRNTIRKLLQENVKGYDSGVYPGEHFLDVYSMAESLALIYGDCEEITELKTSIEDLFLDSVAMTKEFCSDFPIGVYYADYIERNLCDFCHPSAYTWGSMVSDKCSFISACREYVPSVYSNYSLLDYLFYKQFYYDGEAS